MVKSIETLAAAACSPAVAPAVDAATSCGGNVACSVRAARSMRSAGSENQVPSARCTATRRPSMSASSAASTCSVSASGRLGAADSCSSRPSPRPSGAVLATRCSVALLPAGRAPAGTSTATAPACSRPPAVPTGTTLASPWAAPRGLVMGSSSVVVAWPSASSVRAVSVATTR